MNHYAETAFAAKVDEIFGPRVSVGYRGNECELARGLVWDIDGILAGDKISHEDAVEYLAVLFNGRLIEDPVFFIHQLPTLLEYWYKELLSPEPCFGDDREVGTYLYPILYFLQRDMFQLGSLMDNSIEKLRDIFCHGMLSEFETFGDMYMPYRWFDLLHSHLSIWNDLERIFQRIESDKPFWQEVYVRYIASVLDDTAHPYIERASSYCPAFKEAHFERTLILSDDVFELLRQRLDFTRVQERLLSIKEPGPAYAALELSKSISRPGVHSKMMSLLRKELNTFGQQRRMF